MKLQYIDLFCGAGGLGEGFTQSGFSSSFHIDSDPFSIETVKLREAYNYLSKENKLNNYYEYLRKCNGPFTSSELCEQDNKLNAVLKRKTSNQKITHDNIDKIIETIKNSIGQSSNAVIIGGPPCQAYSHAKRSRMRKPTHGLQDEELKKADEKNKELIDKHLKDERHWLYSLYLKIIHDVKPAAFVYENVPGILTAKSGSIDNQSRIIDLISKDLDIRAGGYELLSVNPPPQQSLFHTPRLSWKDFIVNASEFGVPQNRKRFIIIGIKSDVARDKSKDIREIFYSSISKLKVDKKVNVRQAINNLPALSHDSGNNYFYKTSLIQSLYLSLKDYLNADNDYAKQISCRKPRGVLNHFARKHMASDLERYRFYAEFAEKHERNATLHDLAMADMELMPDHKSAKLIMNDNGNKAKDAKYVDRFKVQQWEQPSATITAHISKDGHAYIHPDVEQNRSLTVREAARLQSFPDDYAFCGPRTEQFRQVGNAVPVLLAKAIATAVKNVLEECND